MTESVDCNVPVDTIYTDTSKAFDTLDHNILICKLLTFGISGNLLKWFSSYLNNRVSRVVVNGYSSQPYMTLSGVPQGSVLGPILFNMFINDVVPLFQYGKCFLYADDLKLAKQ